MEKKNFTCLLCILAILMMSKVTLAASISGSYSPKSYERSVADGTSRTFAISTVGAPSNGKVLYVTVSVALYSTSSQPIQDSASRFDSDSWPTDGPIMWSQNTLSKSGDFIWNKTFYSEFDNISPARSWYIIFWNNVTATSNVYVVKNVIVTVYYSLPVQAPVVTISSVTPNPALTTDTVSASGFATNNPTSYEWKCQTHGVVLSFSNSFSHNFTAGNHSVQLTASNSAGSDFESRNITVNAPTPQVSVSSIYLTPSSSQSIQVGTNQQFQAYAKMSDGTTQNITGSASWFSSNPSVLSSQGSGNFSGVSAGQVTVSVQYQVLSPVVSVTVTKTNVPKPVAVIDRAEVRMISDEDHETSTVIFTPETINLINTNIPVRQYRRIQFAGRGTTSLSIQAYQWYRESGGIQTTLSNNAGFQTSPMDLPSGSQTVYFKVQDSDGTWSNPTSINLTIKKFVKIYLPFSGSWKKNGGSGPGQNAHRDFTNIQDFFARDLNFGNGYDDYQKLYICPFEKGRRYIPSFTTESPWYQGWGKQIYIQALDSNGNPDLNHDNEPIFFGISHCALISLFEDENVELGQEIASCGASGAYIAGQIRDLTADSHFHGAVYVLRNGNMVSIDMSPIFLNPNDDTQTLDELPNDDKTSIDSLNSLQPNPNKIVVPVGYVSGATNNDPIYAKFGYDRGKAFSATTDGVATISHTWRPTIAKSGNYAIEVLVSIYKSSTQKAIYHITTAAGENYSASVNQALYINQWVRLQTTDGTEKFSLSVGTDNFVELTNATGETGREITFDAIRFIYMGDQGGGNATPVVTTSSGSGGGGCILTNQGAPVVSILPLILLMIGGLLLQRYKGCK